MQGQRVVHPGRVHLVRGGQQGRGGGGGQQGRGGGQRHYTLQVPGLDVVQKLVSGQLRERVIHDPGDKGDDNRDS